MENKYLPKQIKEHPDFIDYRDVISVVLNKDQLYSLQEAQNIIQNFLNREVD